MRSDARRVWGNRQLWRAYVFVRTVSVQLCIKACMYASTASTVDRYLAVLGRRLSKRKSPAGLVCDKCDV